MPNDLEWSINLIFRNSHHHYFRHCRHQYLNRIKYYSTELQWLRPVVGIDLFLSDTI